jgi:predicted metal-dependent peptidase
MAIKAQNTSNDLPVGITATDSEIAGFDLGPHLVNLMWDEPFFAAMLRDITKVETTDIPTAGVLARDGDIKMWWNRSFVAGLGAKRVKGLLKHEVYHLVFEHTTTRKNTPHLIHNYATDLAINSIIPEDELPEGGLIPGKALTLSPEARDKMSPEAIARFERISAKIESLPPMMSSEWYFGELMSDDQFREDMEPQGGQGGQGGEPGGEGGEGEPKDGVPGTLDDHAGWDEGGMSEAEKELVKGKVKQALKEAVAKCDSSGKWGSVGAEMRGTLRAMCSNEVDWRKVLRNFCGMSQRANKSRTMKRINRKYPYIHSGRKIGHSANVAVYVDQSGSVDDDALALLYAELNQLARKVTFTFLPFDSSVDTDNEFVWKRGSKAILTRYRCGGTNFHAVAEHAEKNRHRFDGYIVMTDGEAGDPGPSRMRRAWVIVPGRKLLFDAHRGDTLVQMKERKKVAA